MTQQNLLTVREFATRSGNIPSQLVVLLHGYGSNGDDLITLAPEFSTSLPDAHFISPNAPFPCELAPEGSASYQWFSLTSHDPDYLYEGVTHVAPILTHTISHHLQRFELNYNDLVLVGFSQGTMLSLHIGLHSKEGCKGILGYSGMLLDAKPIADTITCKPPVCLAHGTADAVVPFTAMAAAEEKLRAVDVPLETHSCENVGHGIDHKGLNAGKQFLSNLLQA